ncbi:MAG: acyl-CoA thioester hydrolase/BAAT C-terminal domain-containing protein, partial [Ginsengibacter sp.]
MYNILLKKTMLGRSIFYYKKISIFCVCVFVFGSFTQANQKEFGTINNQPPSLKDTIKRKALLAEIVKLLPPDETKNGRVSFLDEIFGDWLNRTGELPPDFDKMPSIPFLPDPLIIDEGGKNIPVKTKQQWQEKREWMKKELQYYITGTYPPAPNNLKVKILSEKKEGTVTLRMVELRFGPKLEATLKLEVMIPEGKGPFPVFLSQWYHRGWAQVAVRRGYIGCVYTGADDDDDTEKYSEIWAGKYDFTRLMRRAFGASRAIDYLYTLPVVNKSKIALTGHSRNGKLSLMAAAFDERITAVIPSSGGSGAEVPWRYASHEYDVEDIALLTCAQPSWFPPRLRFFIGRENKLPIDQNSFMALIAPRGLMLSSATNEEASNPWGIEQAYLSAKKVYKFLGAENNLAIRLRSGLHGTRASDIEEYLDFFDYVFKRTRIKPENKLIYNYSFDNWRIKSGETINPLSYSRKGIEDIETSTTGQKIKSIKTWEEKKSNLQKQFRWALGVDPAGVKNVGPVELKNGGAGEEYFGTYLKRPAATKIMGRMAVTPYKEFGDYLYGYLYYPLEKEAEINNGRTKLPVVVYLHEYDYSKGFSSQQYDHAIQPFFEDLVSKGFIVFSYDMIGFGNRIEEGSLFY